MVRLLAVAWVSRVCNTMEQNMKKITEKTCAIDLIAIQHLTVITLMTAAVFLLLCGSAYAITGYTPVGIVLCNVVTMIWSDIGRGIATIAVMVMGIMAAIGKASWGQALLLAIGISLVFGAPAIVPQLIYGKSVVSSFLSGFVGSCA